MWHIMNVGFKGIITLDDLYSAQVHLTPSKNKLTPSKLPPSAQC